MLLVLMVSVPPPSRIKLPMLMLLPILILAELFTYKVPLPVKAPKEIVPLPLFK